MIGHFSENQSWPSVPIKDICESVIDCVNKTATLSDTETPFKMLRTTNVRDGFVAQLSPHISGEQERLRQRTVLSHDFDEPINQRPQPGFGHVGDQIVEQAALPKQRMGSALGGVDLQMSIQAEAFSGRAEQRQKNDREGVQQKQSVAPLRIGDAERTHAHAEA